MWQVVPQALAGAVLAITPLILRRVVGQADALAVVAQAADMIQGADVQRPGTMPLPAACRRAGAETAGMLPQLAGRRLPPPA